MARRVTKQKPGLDPAIDSRLAVDRLKHSRIAVEGVACDDGRVLELSTGGMAIATDDSLVVGECYEFQVAGCVSITICGECLWTECFDGASISGVLFDKQPKPIHYAILKLMNAHQTPD